MRTAGLLAALVAGIVAVVLAGIPGTAQNGETVGFDVMWAMDTTGDTGEACQWDATVTAGEARTRAVSTVGLPGTVTVADASGEVVYIAELAGTYLDTRSCLLAVDATVPASLAYTIRVNGHHAATVPADHLHGPERPIVNLID